MDQQAHQQMKWHITGKLDEITFGIQSLYLNRDIAEEAERGQ